MEAEVLRLLPARPETDSKSGLTCSYLHFLSLTPAERSFSLLASQVPGGGGGTGSGLGIGPCVCVWLGGCRISRVCLSSSPIPHYFDSWEGGQVLEIFVYSHLFRSSVGFLPVR